ncbi:DUF998 domain-containing protein [Streptomyces uncialis]|uniref:DUF998 domain-containing protein n=1 Tax=Streptomyces uncialis TaxID=1048205 RepID=UPI00386C19A0|nr:DUF998 domain-containing protein [Streptomyces uncialis]
MPIRAASRTGPRTTALLTAAGTLAYSAWLLEAVLPTGLPRATAYVSELAAEGEPFSALFRATDLLAGLLLLTAALLGLLRPSARLPWAEGRPWTLVGWSALALFAAATVADSRLPLSCTPTMDAGCAEREHSGLVPLTHSAHLVTSAMATAAALLTAVALTVAARRYGIGGPVARAGTVLVAAQLAATGWTLGAVWAFGEGLGSWGLGVAQRLQLVLLALWLVVFARTLARRPDEGRPRWPS